MNKYIYLFVLQGDFGFGHGWEDLCQSENKAEMLTDFREYNYKKKENENYRVIRRREPNPAYRETLMG